ncbi:hypothetical protein [Rhodocaloribacter sp.]
MAEDVVGARDDDAGQSRGPYLPLLVRFEAQGIPLDDMLSTLRERHR